MKKFLSPTYKFLKRYWFTTKIKNQSATYGSGLKVNNYSSVTGKTYLGRNVNFNGMDIFGKGEVFIGNYFHSGRACKIITSFHDYDEGRTIPYDFSRSIHKTVVIEDCVWLGENVIILGGVTIHEGAIIQAGSVVVNDVPYCAITGGHPAKVFAYRDKLHFEKLKQARKFY